MQDALHYATGSRETEMCINGTNNVLVIIRDICLKFIYDYITDWGFHKMTQMFPPASWKMHLHS